MTRRTFTVTLFSTFAGAVVWFGSLIHGCSEGKTVQFGQAASVEQVTSDTAVALMPKGPDAIGGAGTETVDDIGDFVLMNQHIRAVIDQPGDDPTSTLGPITFPLSNVLAPTGGTLVDLAARNNDNDQWLQSSQGVVGLVTRRTAATGSAGIVGGNNVFVDFTGPFNTNPTVAPFIVPGDTLVITSGLNAGRSYRIGQIVDAATLGLFVPPGVLYQVDSFPPPGSISYAIVHRTSPLSNIVGYDSAAIIGSPQADPVTLRVTGGLINGNGNEVPDGTTVDPATRRLLVGGSPIAVETDYVLFRDAQHLTIESRVENTGGTPIGIASLADIVITGGLGEPNIAPWTPFTGFRALGLGSPVIVPFVSFQGRDEPQVSYTLVDAQVGQMIVVTDGGIVTAAIQLSTATSIDGGDTLSWLRHLAIGTRDDVASSADEAVRMLSNSPVRVNPTTGGTIPNMYQRTVRLEGVVFGAPAGTTVTAVQVSPALTFDAGPPNGLTPATGFYPTTLFGAPELLVTQARVDETGHFRMDVPARFAGLAPAATATTDLAVPSGLESGADATYRLIVDAPGHDPQTTLITPALGGVNNLLFDLRGETGTIEIVVTDENGDPVPAKVVIIGMDPDGAGPTLPTPDPNFDNVVSTAGVPQNIGLPRATGKDNVVHLLDGVGSVEVAPGAYQVIASRGLEYTVDRFPEVLTAPTPDPGFFFISANQVVRTIDSNGDPLIISRVLDADDLPATLGNFDSPLQSYVSADYHVHAGGSFDSAVPLRDRVISYLTTNVEVMVSTEHDNVVDFAPVIAQVDAETAQDVDSMIVSQIGVESTGFVPVFVSGVLEYPNTIGHFNAWPIERLPALRRNGAPPDEYRSPAALYEQLRTLDAVIIQMNHPRFPILAAPLPPIGLGFLTNHKVGFPQPNTGTDALTMGGGYATPLRTLSSAPVVIPGSTADGGIDDFNEIRTAGGTRDNSYDVHEVYGGNLTLYDINRLDWYALMSAGYVRTGSANSDSHDLAGEPGFPRNYVFTTGDGSQDVGTVDLVQLTNDVRPSLLQATPGTNVPPGAPFPATERNSDPEDMNVIGTSGPIVIIEVDANEDGTFEGGIGDLVTDDGDEAVDIRVTVLAAPWVSVTGATIIVNGGNAAGPLTGLRAGSTNISGALIQPTGGPFSTDLTDVVRMRQVFSVALAPTPGLPGNAFGDDWIIVEVRGTAVTGSVFDLLNPGIDTPVGFTNPVFINKQGDTDWDPPGVP